MSDDDLIHSPDNPLDKLTSAVQALDTIEQIAKHILGDEAKDAFEAMHIIAVIINTVNAGFKGQLTAEAVTQEIQSLRKTLLDNDTVADQALEDKFDGSDKPA